MRSRRLAALACAVITAGAARAQTTIVTFEAELGRAAAKAHAPFTTGTVSWHCTTTHCSGTGPSADPAATCAALVKQVGPLKDFTAAGKRVDVKACNGVTPAMSSRKNTSGTAGLQMAGGRVQAGPRTMGTVVRGSA